MKILLAAKHVPSGPRPIGGVQSWIRTVRAEIEALGHEVTEWQPGFDLPAEDFDRGIFANWRLTRHLAGRCLRTVNVCHGIIGAERPGEADRLLFVSEGVRDFWKLPGDILRQPIDLDFWSPGEADRKGAVRFSYRTSSTLCEAAAKALGLRYRQVQSAGPEQARKALRGAAVVFASGRAALESMACGAPTVIYDHRSAYQAPLMDTWLPRQIENSYSGRGGFSPTTKELIETASNLMAMGGEDGRAWVEKHHDARKIVQELMA